MVQEADKRGVCHLRLSPPSLRQLCLGIGRSQPRDKVPLRRREILRPLGESPWNPDYTALHGVPVDAGRPVGGDVL